MFANHSRKLPPDRPLRSGEQRSILHESEKALELLIRIQQSVIDFFPPDGQLWKRVYFIVEQLAGLFRVVEGIIQLIRLKLVVLQQRVIRALREQQRREVERIDCPGGKRRVQQRPQIEQVVAHDVVSAQEGGAGNEGGKIPYGWGMELSTVLFHSP